MITNEVVDRWSEAEAILDGRLAAYKVAVCLREGIRISHGSSCRWLCLHFSELVDFFHSVATGSLSFLRTKADVVCLHICVEVSRRHGLVEVSRSGISSFFL